MTETEICGHESEGCGAISDSGAGNRVALRHHRSFSGSLAEPVHDPAADWRAELPSILRRVRSWRMHLTGIFQSKSEWLYEQSRMKILQAQFAAKVATTMACFFAITTPSGIAAGAALSSFYNPNSPRGLVVEGVLDSISAGILIYMALVDLIGADFLSRNLSCSTRLQALSYVALFLGALSMALLALWA